MNCIPWVEKYRPEHFDDIVLDNYNKEILQNIIKSKYFPNLLFYGPPGTGKTTTMINLIKEYENKINKKVSMIHLNASDERGIDIIRNQINSFVSSKSIFSSDIKFVILDEVDYMTKNAQSALRYLLQKYNNDCLCLICNYISKIDESLQNEFVRLRFNQLPIDKIFTFLKKINSCENLNYSQEKIYSLQDVFNSDLRSMINYMQTNQDNSDSKLINNALWENTYISIKTDSNEIIKKKIYEIIKTYNIEVTNFFKLFLNYVIENKSFNKKFLFFCEQLIHTSDCEEEIAINYFICKKKLF